MKQDAKNKKPWIMLLLAAVLVLAGLIGFQFFKQWENLREINAAKAEQSAQLQALKAQNDSMQQALEDSKTDSFVIRMAHELLGWVMKGEIKIVDKDK
jgi:cell division protein FtsB